MGAVEWLTAMMFVIVMSLWNWAEEVSAEAISLCTVATAACLLTWRALRRRQDEIAGMDEI